MFFRNRLQYLRALLMLGLLAVANPAWALTCQQVRQLATLYLKYHFAHDTFDDELSKRTLDQFVKSWDPGKLYFFKKDVDAFRDKYALKLDDMINGGNCDAISEVVKVYAQRFDERHKMVNKLIMEKYDFTKDEYMDIDRKKQDFASTQEELDERWRKRVKFQLLQLRGTLGDDAKAKEKLNKRYQIVVKRHNEQTIDTVYSAFLNAFSSSLDPHSEYMGAEQLEDFRIDTKLSLEGIGAVLRSEDGFTIIQSIVPGGAASKNGKFKLDDKIIAVAQSEGEPVDVIDMDLREVVRLIRGTAGTEVKLTVIREEGGETKKLVLPVVREKIQLQGRVAKGTSFDVKVKDPASGKAEGMKIGVLNLPSFYVDFEGMHSRSQDYRSSSRDVREELAKLAKDKIDALVLDLRSNGGGSLEESIRVAGLFFDSGPVVQVKGVEGASEAQSDTDGKTYYSGPLLVLINRQSASASEILAGAIQDYERGLILGDSHTFGKGTVQNLNDIGEKLGAVKITISKFYRPSGGTTQLRGVESDIVFPSLVDLLEIGEKHYDYALPWDQIKPASFNKLNLTKPYVETLSKLSGERVKGDPEFKKIFDEIEKYKKGEAERFRVSLKEDKDTAKKNQEEEAEELAERRAYMANEPVLDEDAHLQEALRVASDYARLLKKQKTGLVEIPALIKAAVAKKEKAAKAKKPTVADAEQKATKQPGAVANEAPIKDAAPARKGAKGIN